MTSRSLLVTAVWLVVAILTQAEAVRATEASPITLRRLCIEAPVVVLAVPVDPMTPTRFTVQAVLRGTIKTGATIEPMGLTAAMVQTFEEPNRAEQKPRPRKCAHAILFLEPGNERDPWKLVPGGVRLCSEEGTYLALESVAGPVVAKPGIRWPVIVQRVRKDLASIDQLYQYRRIGRPSRRASALLGWVQDRKGEFASRGPGTEEAPIGWEHLQLDIFDWIFVSAGLDDAWRAVRLYAELNQGDCPRVSVPLFANPQGRAYLVGLACDPSLLLGDRTRAVDLLGQAETLSPGEKALLRGAVALTREERDNYRDKLMPLLAEDNDEFRFALARTLLHLEKSAPGRSSALVTALIKAYRDARYGPAHNELAVTLCELASPAQWKELTGNAPGYCACLRDMDFDEDNLVFWLSFKTPGPAVFEAPSLVFEKLGTLGFVSETKRFPLQPLNLEKGWEAGWNGSDVLAVQFDVNKLAPDSNYRVRVEGVAGKGPERVKWSSEAQKFKSPPKPMDERGRGKIRR